MRPSLDAMVGCLFDFFLRCTSGFLGVPHIPPSPPPCMILLHRNDPLIVLHHNALSRLFTLPSLATRLYLQIQALISSSEKFGVVIDGRRQGDLGGEAHLTSACRLRASISISPPPPPAMALATTTVALYPPAGWRGRAAPFWAAAAVECAPCLKQSPPLRTCLAHPTWLHRFLVAPCVTQTPPCRALLAHPSLLQRLVLAPCVAQSPPLTAPLAHPSWLHRFLVAPCVVQTPPFRASLAHPSLLQFFLPIC